MSSRIFWLPPAILAALVVAAAPAADGPFTMAQVLGYPYPNELVTASSGAAMAWVFNEHGVRNIWVAEAPDWKARRLTNGTADDGQELGQLQFTRDGKTVIYVRGGDHDANWDAPPPDPDHSPLEPKVRIWSVPVSGGVPKMLTEGDAPLVSPKGDIVAVIKNGQVWSIPVDGSKSASQLVFARGDNNSMVWSPDGSKLAFISDRRGPQLCHGIHRQYHAAPVSSAPSDVDRRRARLVAGREADRTTFDSPEGVDLPGSCCSERCRPGRSGWRRWERVPGAWSGRAR